MIVLPTGGAWQRRSARPGQWQPPCGLPCRARLRGSIAPCRAYQSLGNISKALEHHNEHLTIAKEVGDRAGEGQAYGNLGTCHLYLNEYVKAVAYSEAQHALALSLQLDHVQSDAALNMGVALTLHVRAARQGLSAGADQAPGPHSHSSASACLNDRVREAAKWLQAALDGRRPFAKKHLAHLTF